MKKTKEMKIYELLGIKKFKKVVLKIEDILLIAFTRIMKKEGTKQEKSTFHNIRTNYRIGKVKSVEDIRSFKKILCFNVAYHTWGLVLCFNAFFIILSEPVSLSLTIIAPIATFINLYCVMLQRYNCIRINQLIKETTLKQEVRKDKVKEDVRKEDVLLNEHVYKIVDNRNLETDTTLEELMSNATLEQLKQYREYLQNMNQRGQKDTFFLDEIKSDISIPIEKGKYLKLEFKGEGM